MENEISIVQKRNLALHSNNIDMLQSFCHDMSDNNLSLIKIIIDYNLHFPLDFAQKILIKFANGSFEQKLFAITSNKTSSKILSLMVNDDDDWLRCKIAENIKTFKKDLIKLSNDNNDEVLISLLRNDIIDNFILNRLYKRFKNDKYIISKIMNHKNISKDLVDKISKTGNIN